MKMTISTKVKTALLLIQKDFESKIGFSPINVRPIPMFSMGFFEIDPRVQEKLKKRYPECVEEIEEQKHICRVRLSAIWNKDYKTHSFPKFKFMVYSKSEDIDFITKYPMSPALCVNIGFETIIVAYLGIHGMLSRNLSSLRFSLANTQL